ncbi:MAG: trypsin-like peptidase domain-containing protein [Polyangiaceae bacterium]|nr:trypsin-like peptidase domain-containing protein [Polyangiaceae bacterium]
MSRSRVVTLPALVLVSLAAACASTPRTAKAPTTAGASACADIGPVLDLRAELLEAPPVAGEAGLLSDLDDDLAALELAAPRLGSAPASRELRAEIESLAREVRAESEALTAAARRVEVSYAVVDSALDAALTCQGVDLRFLEARPGASRLQRTSAAFNGASAEAKAQSAKNKVIVDAKACAPARRILAAVGALDVTSKVSTAAVGEHLAEIVLDGKSECAKSDLAKALLSHSANLAAFAQTANPKDATTSFRTRASTLLERLERRARECLDTMSDPSPEIVVNDREPRQVTVLVKPKWPARYAGVATDTGVFGSGILIRWRTPAGNTETRVVTNAHVLDGAEEAEIFDADTAQMTEADGKKASEKAWKAKVARISRDDDLAVLRLDGAPATALHGLGLRLSPPREDEAVVAAGFPGLGARPSFQLTRGTISNASYRSGTGAFGAYLQHTAAIDHGNSGGPLLDGEGRLLGINTIKVFGRESVGFAIPAVRVQLALLRAGDRRTFLPGHASALCTAFVGAMSSRQPHGAIVERISLGLHDAEARTVDARTAAYRDAVTAKGEGPIWAARHVSYARLRVRLEDEGGVAPLTACTNARRIGTAGASFEATFRSRGASHTLRIEDEEGTLRVAEMK